jgi:hypothetical protein
MKTASERHTGGALVPTMVPAMVPTVPPTMPSTRSTMRSSTSFRTRSVADKHEKVEKVLDLLVSDAQFMGYVTARLHRKLRSCPPTPTQSISRMHFQQLVDGVIDEAFINLGIAELLDTMGLFGHPVAASAEPPVRGVGVDTSDIDISDAFEVETPVFRLNENEYRSESDSDADTDRFMVPKFSSSEPDSSTKDTSGADGNKRKKPNRTLLNQVPKRQSTKPAFVGKKGSLGRNEDFNQTGTFDGFRLTHDSPVQACEPNQENADFNNSHAACSTGTLGAVGTDRASCSDSDEDTVERGRPLGLASTTNESSLESMDEFQYFATRPQTQESSQLGASAFPFRVDDRDISTSRTVFDGDADAQSVGISIDSLAETEELRYVPNVPAARPSRYSTGGNGQEDNQNESSFEMLENTVERTDSILEDRVYEDSTMRQSASSTTEPPEFKELDEPELLVAPSGWAQLYGDVIDTKPLKPSRQVRFPDEEVARTTTTPFVNDIVTNVVFIPRYSKSDLSEMFWTHAESTRFHTDYDIEVERAAAEGLTWIEWMDKRTDEEIAEEDAALREVMAMNELLLEFESSQDSSASANNTSNRNATGLSEDYSDEFSNGSIENDSVGELEDSSERF